MKFSRLLAAVEAQLLRARGNAEVADVQSDSRCCTRGSCFVALRGPNDDGHAYIQAALGAGAEAVVCEEDAAVPPDVPCAVAGDSRECIGRLAQAIRGRPAEKLISVGITGTNGKSTVAHLLQAALEAAGRSSGLIGTIRYDTGSRQVPARITTPGAVELAEMMAEMVAAGKTHLVMETSSHALDQRRTDGIDFKVAVFTSLSGDHLDYHANMENYFAAKRRLFETLRPDSTAVLNRDDPAGEKMAAATPGNIVWYGLGADADVRGKIKRSDAEGTSFEILSGGDKVEAYTPLIGRHNVSNCLAAVAAAVSLGVSPAAAAEALASVERIPGRLERVASDLPYDVFVDYAHTDDALRNVLCSLRSLSGGRILLAFGCGGDRDRAKRPRMARVAEEFADRIIVTSDNPRSEDPQAIIDEILIGLSDRGRRRTDVRVNRREAIELAISEARPGDMVLIAGKGHETYQIIGDRRIHFDDVETAAETIARRREGRS
ncbi:MAG: UDP-N-acetylmuramoyl-L-alanyl-D-glutamate--2,6-diaminopimelate ligase [Planctomycetota bacterium]|jgi:UDP-N-acetylmuramoyl-L-alanyl-D-glutamate--2,6-diaminopimelate ligase